MSLIYPLDHPLVQAARQQFYRNRHQRKATTRCRLSFEPLYRRFSEELPNFDLIEEEAGINRSSLDHLHDNNFMHLFPGKRTAAQRRQLFRDARRLKYISDLRSTLPQLPCVELISAGARQAGHSVEALVRVNEKGWVQGVSQTQIVISGVPCRIHPIKTTKPVAKRHNQQVARAILRREMLELAPVQLYPVLVPRATPHTLVIPSEELGEEFFPSDCELELRDLSIPIFFGKKPRRRGFDFWSFADRWDIIPAAAW